MATKIRASNLHTDVKTMVQTMSDENIAAKSTDDISEGSNLYYTDARADTRVGTYISGDRSYGNITTTGYLRGPASFTIDPAAHGDNTGTLVVAGNLQVDGTTTTINSTTVAIDDLNFSIATDAANSSAANGAGITVGGAGATLLYTHATTSWDMNKPLNVTGSITADNGSSTVQLNGNSLVFDRNSANYIRTSDAAGYLRLQTGSGDTAFFSANGDISFYEDTGTTPKFFWDASAERLGIGTSSPSAPIDVVTNSNVYAAEFTQSNTSNGDGVIVQVGSTSSSDYALTVRSDGGNTSGLAVKADGKVGIGTFLPQDTLHVVTDTSTTNDTVDVVRIEATSSGTPVVGFGPTIEFRAERGGASADSVGRLGFVADNMTASRVDGAFVAETAIDGAFTERLRISSTGNVGIGTTDPKRPLQIGGTGAFPISFNGNYPDIHMNTYYESGWRIHTAGFGAKTTFNGATGAFGFSNVASSQSAGATFTPQERLTILANGNVGIGTATPSQIFEVQKAANDKLVYGSNPRLLLDTPTGINGLRVLGDTTPFEFKIDSGTYNGSTFSMGGTGDVSLLGTTTTASDTFNDSPTFFFNSMRWNGSANATHFQGAIKGHTRSATNGDGYLGIGANANANHLNIDASSGNVGIGTSSPDSWASYTDSSATVLQVRDTSQRARIVINGGNGAHLDLVDYAGSANDKHMNIAVDAGVLKFGSLNDAGNAFVQNNIMVMDLGTGNVGIGTTNPTAKLHVDGDLLTNDLILTNMDRKDGPNEVDGTRGHWCIQEGEEDLFLINRNTGKKYKFNITEVVN